MQKLYLWVGVLTILGTGFPLESSAEEVQMPPKPRLEVARDACERAVSYSSGSAADYVPGVDVHGKEVVPADVDPSVVLNLPERFDIPLQLDIASHFGGAVATYPFDTNLPVGTITLDLAKNQLLFNGKPLNPQQQEDLQALCDHALGNVPMPAAEESPDASDGSDEKNPSRP